MTITYRTAGLLALGIAVLWFACGREARVPATYTDACGVERQATVAAYNELRQAKLDGTTINCGETK